SLELEGKTAAYPWLVMAHVHRHGWQSYWTSSDEVVRRLGWAAKYYKDRWRQYVSDTSRQSRYWERRKHSFSIGIKYLVHFLLLEHSTLKLARNRRGGSSLRIPAK
ncbi:MAG TPA: hypothetical protein VF077_09170, partial [Nitrospiraceae bacterium]